MLILVCVSYVLASSSCISLAALKEYEAAREPLQNIEKFLGKCYGSYSTKEPIVTMRRSIEQLEKQFKEVNKMFYGKFKNCVYQFNTEVRMHARNPF